MQAPKNGFFYVLDRLTGEFISAEPISRVNWASGIDKATGRPIETPQARYFEGAVEIYPGPRGAHNWHPMSFNPSTGLVYIPGQENSFVFRSDPASALGVVFGRGAPPPATAASPPVVPASIGAAAPAGQPGFLVAWDPVAQKERWRLHLATRENGGTLTTAGHLVFSGSATGMFFAHDARTGQKLWETQLYPNVGTPVTYLLDGRQYIALLTGTLGNTPPGKVLAFALDAKESLPGRSGSE
jgi:glucose dehydrogenase